MIILVNRFFAYTLGALSVSSNFRLESEFCVIDFFHLRRVKGKIIPRVVVKSHAVLLDPLKSGERKKKSFQRF